MTVTFTPQQAAAIRLAASISGYRDPLEFVRASMMAVVKDCLTTDADDNLPIVTVEQPIHGRDILSIHDADLP